MLRETHDAIRSQGFDKVRAVAYRDTVKWFSRRRPPDDLTDSLFDQYGYRRRVWIDPVKRQGRIIGYKITVHQPTDATVTELTDYYGYSIHSVHAATDLFGGGDELNLDQLIRFTAMMNWRGKYILREDRGTLYWSDKKAGRNIAYYSDHLSKTRLSNDTCSHWEHRITGSAAVKRAKLRRA